MRHAVGFDHGTTYSSVATVRLDKQIPNMLKLDSGSLQTPTVLAIDDTVNPPKIETGKIAENQDRVHPERVLKWYKPLLETESGFEFNNYSLTELTTFMIQSLKEQTERKINEQVDSALITVPAWFHDNARDITAAAAKAAGIADVHLINEPTAAAYFSHVQNPLKANDIMLVFDLGGGTFDTSIVKYLPDGTLEVKASQGDMKLGGHLWTLKLQEEVAALYLKDHNIDLMEDAEGNTISIMLASSVSGT